MTSRQTLQSGRGSRKLMHLAPSLETRIAPEPDPGPLAKALKQLGRQFGAQAVTTLANIPALSVIETGSPALDIAVGLGGLPIGRIIEVFGAEDCGKTSLALRVVANAQRTGRVCAYIDADHALDPDYAKALGVAANLATFRPVSAEDALSMADTLAASGALDLLVIDSMPSLVPRAELEGEMGDAHGPLQARLLEQALRRILPRLSRHGCSLILVNQIRVREMRDFQNELFLPCGNAPRSYASVRIELVPDVDQEADQPNRLIRAHVIKNRHAAPLKYVALKLTPSSGFCTATELVGMAIRAEILKWQADGLWYGRIHLGESAEQAILVLQRRPALAARLGQRLRSCAARVARGLPSHEARHFALEPDTIF